METSIMPIMPVLVLNRSAMLVLSLLQYECIKIETNGPENFVPLFSDQRYRLS